MEPAAERLDRADSILDVDQPDDVAVVLGEVDADTNLRIRPDELTGSFPLRHLTPQIRSVRAGCREEENQGHAAEATPSGDHAVLLRIAASPAMPAPPSSPTLESRAEARTAPP
jgi:hypothetical protein